MSINIGKLYTACEDKIKNVYTTINDEMIKLSGQFYIEDETAFYFTSVDEFAEDSVTTEGIISGIENESADECWQPERITDKNRYLDCEVVIANGCHLYDSNTALYEIDTIKETNKAIILVCKDKWE